VIYFFPSFKCSRAFYFSPLSPVHLSLSHWSSVQTFPPSFECCVEGYYCLFSVSEETLVFSLFKVCHKCSPIKSERVKSVRKTRQKKWSHQSISSCTNHYTNPKISQLTNFQIKHQLFHQFP